MIYLDDSGYEAGDPKLTPSDAFKGLRLYPSTVFRPHMFEPPTPLVNRDTGDECDRCEKEES